MHSREITHLVKTDCKQLIVKTKHSLFCQLRKFYVKTKQSTMFNENTIQKLDLRH